MRSLLGPLALLALAAPATAQTPDEIWAAMEDGLLPTFVIAGSDTARRPLLERMDELGVPGVSVAVLIDGEIAWARGWGMADVAGGREVGHETLFQAASISKPVAALGMLRLVEQERLALDRDVNELLEGWTLPDNEFTATEKVTLRRLLNHTAGTTVWGFPGYEPAGEIPTTVDVLEGRGNTDAIRVWKEPGESWRYSGGGYTVAQLLASEAGGAPFEEVMRELVLEPAGMTHSTYAQPLPEERRPEAALAYHPDGSPYEGGMHVYPEQAAAGLWTTPSDLLRYARAVQDAAAGAPGALLSREMAREMLTPGMESHGLGPGIQEGGVHFGHGGSNAGFRCLLTASIDGGYGVAVMTNSDAGGRLASEVILTLAHLYGWVGPRPSVRRVVALAPARIERLVGVYRMPEDGPRLEVSREGEGLLIRAGDEELRFVPESATVFFDRTSGQTITFEEAEGGAITALRVGSMRAERVREGG
jgi:CubicO group peptidase (beta-lactamase class C family)